MAKKRKNSLDSENKSRRGVDWKASGIATLAASVAMSLGLTLGTASKENKNYKGDYLFSHNLKEMAEGSKQLERGEPLPIFTGKLLITHDGDPYEVKDSVKVYFDVDEHFTLDTHIINGKGYEELQKIMREVALKKDSSAVVGFDFAKKGVEPHISSQETKVDAVKGYASPEAIKYGGSSLKIGNIELENIRTAEYRAKVGRDSLMMTLAKIATDNPDLDIDVSSINISGEEIQLNEEELKTLEDLASFEGYSSVESMIDANERGKINNKSVSEVINKIIKTKRHVVVTFTKKGEPDTIYVVPLVLLPILVFKKKKPESKGGGNEVKGGEDNIGGTEGGTKTGGGNSDTEGGGMGIYPPLTIFGGGKGGTEGEGGGTGGGGTGGGGGDGPWPWPLPKSRDARVYKKGFVASDGKQRTEMPMVQRKQPRDKRPHNFSNERKGGFSRGRAGRTDSK